MFTSCSLQNGFPGWKGFEGDLFGTGVEQLENEPESKESMLAAWSITTSQNSQNTAPAI